jgi:hypothetical protein
VELTDGAKDLRFFCQACPYIYTITQKVEHFSNQEMFDSAWRN